MIAPSRLSPALLSVLGLSLVACVDGRETAENAHLVVERLFDERGEMFTAEALLSREEVLQWQFQSAADMQPWRHRGFDVPPKVSRGRLELSYSELGAWLQRGVNFEAASIDLLEVEMEGEIRGPLRLMWAGEDGKWSPERRLQVAAQPHRKPPVYIFDLSRQDTWQGPIRKLRLVPRLRPNTEIRLTKVRGLRSRWQSEALAAAKQRSWKVELADETRTARLQGHGERFVETLQVPVAGRLGIAFASLPRIGKPTTFELLLRRGDEEVLRRRERVTLGGQGPLVAGRWHDLSLDLQPWAGSTLELSLSTEIENGDTDDFAFWADAHLTALQPGPRPPDVVLIVLDTLRADHMSLYGYQRPTTPKLDAWAAQRATVFESTVAASAWTFPSHVSMFTGLDTLGHGQHNPRPIPESFDLLAERLQGAGYRTLAVTGGGYVDPQYGFASGFDRYVAYAGDKKGIGDLTPSLEEADTWLAEEERPLFLFLHTYEVHSPYRVREPYYEQLTGQPGDTALAARLTPVNAERGQTPGALARKAYAWRQEDGSTVPLDEAEHQVVRDIYDASLAFADDHVGSFLEQLEDRPGEPLVIITSDHGEALGDHGGLAEHAYLLDFNLMIPLIVRLPGGAGAGQRVATQVRQVDIAPTVLSSLGMAPAAGLDGKSLLPLIEDPQAEFSEPAWSATALQGIALRKDNRFKYIYNHTPNQRGSALEALFMLTTDPGESQNLAARRPTDDLRQAVIERYQRQFDGMMVTVENPSRQGYRLEALGPLWMTPQYLKTVDAPAGALKAYTADWFEVTIAPGDRFSFVVEQTYASSGLQLQLVSGGDTCRLELQTPGRGEDPAAGTALAQFFAADCSPLQGLQDPRRGEAMSLGIFFSASGGATAGEGAVLPADLQQQLEALGYVD